MIRRQVTAGLVERGEASGGLLVWKLTEEGRAQCPPPEAKRFPKNRNRQPSAAR